MSYSCDTNQGLGDIFPSPDLYLNSLVSSTINETKPTFTGIFFNGTSISASGIRYDESSSFTGSVSISGSLESSTFTGSFVPTTAYSLTFLNNL